MYIGSKWLGCIMWRTESVTWTEYTDWSWVCWTVTHRKVTRSWVKWICITELKQLKNYFFIYFFLYFFLILFFWNVTCRNYGRTDWHPVNGGYLDCDPDKCRTEIFGIKLYMWLVAKDLVVLCDVQKVSPGQKIRIGVSVLNCDTQNGSTQLCEMDLYHWAKTTKKLIFFYIFFF
jgi:hypothetical protein